MRAERTRKGDLMEVSEAGYYRTLYNMAITYYRTLYNIAVAINSSLDPETVLGSIVRNTADTLETKACSIMLLSPDRRELFHSASHGLSDRYVRKGPLKVDESMAETLKGRSVVIGDVGSDPKVQYRSQAIQEGIASMLSVPIRLRGDVIGLMRLYSSESREFSDEETGFVEAVANLGAIALENARRFEAATARRDGAMEQGQKERPE
jgi:GAF domain-containing protein